MYNKECNWNVSQNKSEICLSEATIKGMAIWDSSILFLHNCGSYVEFIGQDIKKETYIRLGNCAEFLAKYSRGIWMSLVTTPPNSNT